MPQEPVLDSEFPKQTCGCQFKVPTVTKGGCHLSCAEQGARHPLTTDLNFKTVNLSYSVKNVGDETGSCAQKATLQGMVPT